MSRNVHPGRHAVRRSLAPLFAFTLIAAACGDDDGAVDDATEEPADDTETTAPADDPAEEPADEPADDGGEEMAGPIQAHGECGLGTGEPATGEPIRIGATVNNDPVANFSWISSISKAYFDCVNDNGGINGRPVEHITYEEQSDPAHAAANAVRLAEEDGVVGFVGSTSFFDCSVNAQYYLDNGFYPIIAGVDHACFTTPNMSAVNMGPYYSSLGGAQAALRAGATGTLVVASGNAPGFDLINSGVVEFAEENGLAGVSILEDAPFADPAGFAQRLVQEAGEGGGVVLDFTGPIVLPVLQAIEQQGLIDTVIWASSTPPNDPTVAQALSEAWDGKFLINAEFSILDSGLPDQNHMNEVMENYGPGDVPLSSFAQMGYLAGRIATEALLGIEGDITVESVNEAFRSITNFETDLLCKPWYSESGVGGNVSNNTDYTVVPEGDKMVLFEDCFEIDPLANTDTGGANLLAEIREAEAAGGLNVGMG